MANYGKPVNTLGAFEAPKPVEVKTTDASGKPTVTKFKPETHSLQVDLGTGAVTPQTKPVDIPKVDWGTPQTVVTADPKVASKGTGPVTKSVVTFTSEPARVNEVLDGDTAKLTRSNGSSITCRIDNINAPEIAHNGKPAQAFGNAAKQTLQNLIDQKRITLKVTKEAVPGVNYGRANCQFEIEGKDVSAEMIKAGAAWLYRRYSNDPELAKLEATAKASKVGLWGDRFPIDPEKYSQMKYWR